MMKYKFLNLRKNSLSKILKSQRNLSNYPFFEVIKKEFRLLFILGKKIIFGVRKKFKILAFVFFSRIILKTKFSDDRVNKKKKEKFSNF